MIAIRGAGSQIARHLLNLLPSQGDWIDIGGLAPECINASRFLFCEGLIRPRRIDDQTRDEIAQTFLVNAGRIIADCDRIIAANDRAHICVIGSESGFTWSFDGAYAAAKAALHRYVETKRLRTPDQQLICIAPGIIGDAGMTLRRDDVENLAARAAQHPKGRFLKAVEVARLIHYCLYVDDGYLSGHVIRMNGGESTCRA